ncbi:hypothetical protein KBB96_04585 [Luteolibacter ambystomatis]|uniref:S1-like domain-containing protein n=1 Tax=Luteolibacter ambystomatis TaxID=2824561 RepID=A0A975J187_9BACT|nr:hypothetical protein [Luteolibacter ambystomatis]QUE52171.1 hypothetical protein KBB96_04585 [Luteolibacter ambystomatis]
MFDDPPVRTIATIEKPVGPNLYHAALPNGKIVIAHLSKPLLEEQTTFEAGQQVHVELTPYDFDTARIMRLA